MNRRLALALVLAGSAGAPAVAEEKLDWAAIGRIRDEGFRHSQVMETAAQLTDVLRPAPDRLAAVQEGGRLVAAAARDLGPRERPPRELARSGAAGASSAAPRTSWRPMTFPLWR